MVSRKCGNDEQEVSVKVGAGVFILMWPVCIARLDEYSASCNIHH